MLGVAHGGAVLPAARLVERQGLAVVDRVRVAQAPHADLPQGLRGRRRPQGRHDRVHGLLGERRLDVSPRAGDGHPRARVELLISKLHASRDAGPAAVRRAPRVARADAVAGRTPSTE